MTERIETKAKLLYPCKLTGGQYRDTTAGTTYWVYKLPKSEGIIKHGYSDYYESNDLRHDIDNGYSKFQLMDDMAVKYGATIAINCSPLDYGWGFNGVNIYNGDIRRKKEKDEGYNGRCTLAIDDNGDFKYYHKTVTAQTILNDGFKNAVDVMTPVLMNGQQPSNEIKSESNWNDRAPRSAIGQDKDCNYYIFMVFSGRIKGENGVTYEDMSRIAKEHGCYNCFALDGGGSSELIINGKKINYDVEPGGRRLRANLLYVQEKAVFSSEVDKISTNSNLPESQRDSLDNINKSGIYWSYWDTIGNPNKDISHGVLQMRVGDNAALQVAFPFSDTGYKIKTRRTNSSGNFNPWVNL